MQGKEQLEKARERVIDAISQNMNLYGVTPSVGRLWGLMYFQDEPMTLDDMKLELGMSKTSMSTSVRSLVELKMVDKVWKKGMRKDLYEVEEDWYQTFIDFFTIKWRSGVNMNVSAIEKSLKELHALLDAHDVNEEIKETARHDIDKLNNALQYYQWLNRLVDSFESHEIFTFVPK
ncbi:choline uptake/conversion transcriptional regulator CudC [Ferdinandcohnia quinoae]|uniref:HTH-type transcriptional regulator n=1 Tax=Fredinandcohnia quinoae TaxID=2918902 RepID=A0AAW5EBX3_9BACI|nr:GbsR/MarR family transcriptional regulator [Fredinandcohnia sp. SECRCQ15]MCH1627546.1 GbsR/MarR family transcriptional regulator [Fredinandcohnia sp. SECRCQ15]